MALSVNKVILIGNLGRDPELRFTPSGVAVATFSIATSEGWKDEHGEWQDRTEWHNIVVWKGAAEYCSKNLSKGSKVYIEGKLQTRKWQDRNGNDRYTTEIIARQIINLSPKERTGDSQQEYGGGDSVDDGQAGGYNPSEFDDIPF